jgi:flagellum-specific peptidoglycan hydrolase FlgJ
MIQSNPLPGLLNRENKSLGPNPYQQNAAGLLQQFMAQQEKQAQLYAQAAAANQQEANKSNGGVSMDQISKLMAKFKPEETKPLQWENAPMPTGEPHTIAPPEMQPNIPQTRYGMGDVGNMSYAKPSASFTEMLPKLTAAAKATYPDNPTMQQVALSQAILESGLNSRPSELATRHNNYFGIKASRSFPGTGGTVDMPTQEYVGGSPATMNQGFATNNSMGDSFTQHARLMSGSSRYSPVMQSKTPGEAFGALQQAGYATDPNYARKLRSIHQQYVSPLYG